MKPELFIVMAWVMVFAGSNRLAAAGSEVLQMPAKVEAGKAFSIETRAAGKAVLYIVGPAQVVRRSVEPGQSVSFAAGDLHNAGLYAVTLVQSASNSSEKGELNIVPASEVRSLSFLAKPSRLPVNQPDGISGVAYLFDAFRNLVQQPLPVAFQLSDTAGVAQTQKVVARNGVAWVKMNSAPKAGAARFQVNAGEVAEKRIVQRVPGEPCNIRMNAQRSGQRIVLQTEPVHDCTGNAVSDGTIVTFTETRNGRSEAMVDVPLKRGVARTEMPALNGAVISVATGIAMGNEIRLGDRP